MEKEIKKENLNKKVDRKKIEDFVEKTLKNPANKAAFDRLINK